MLIVFLALIGLGWGILGLRLICGVSVGQVSAPLEWLTAVVALVTMVSLSVWGGKAWRPVAVLAGLEAVDAVVVFDQDTPFELVQRLQPDVIVKGGDYSPDTIVGAELVAARGGRVVVVPLVAGQSTTSIIEKLRG